MPLHLSFKNFIFILRDLQIKGILSLGMHSCTNWGNVNVLYEVEALCVKPEGILFSILMHLSTRTASSYRTPQQRQ